MTKVYELRWAAGIMLFSPCLERLLLICDKKGVWRFPSTRLGPVESFLEAASRELLKETNIPQPAYTIVVSPIPLVSSKDSKKDADEPRFITKVRLIFPAILRSPKLPQVSPVIGITSDAAWLTIQEAILATKNLKRAASISLGHAVAKGVFRGTDCNLDKIALGLPIVEGAVAR